MRGRANPDERLRELERQWKESGDPSLLERIKNERVRMGMAPEPETVEIPEYVVATLGASGVGKKRMTGAQAREAVRRWLSAAGWTRDPHPSAGANVWISPSGNRRVTFLRTHLLFERGGRRNWKKDYRIHDYGAPLGTIDFAHRLVTNCRRRRSELLWSDPWRPNPDEELRRLERVAASEGTLSSWRRFLVERYRLTGEVPSPEEWLREYCPPRVAPKTTPPEASSAWTAWDTREWRRSGEEYPEEPPFLYTAMAFVIVRTGQPHEAPWQSFLGSAIMHVRGPYRGGWTNRTDALAGALCASPRGIDAGVQSRSWGRSVLAREEWPRQWTEEHPVEELQRTERRRRRRRRRNPDEGLRRLERAAAAGDPDAEATLERRILGMEGLDRDERFFYEHAGYSYPSDASPSVRILSRIQGARELAEAERRAHDLGWRVSWDADHDYHEPTEDEAWQALLYDEHGIVIDGLFGILLAPGIGNEPYCRVVEAQLALEALNLEY